MCNLQFNALYKVDTGGSLGHSVSWCFESHHFPHACSQYDVLFEVDTEELTEELYRVGQFEGTTQLVVESHEEGWLAKQLVQANNQQPLKVRRVSACDMASAGDLGASLTHHKFLHGSVMY